MQKSMVYYRYKHKLTRSVIPVALVNTTEMFKKAYANGYAIGAFNVNNMEIVQGITEAVSYTHLCKCSKSCTYIFADNHTYNEQYQR